MAFHDLVLSLDGLGGWELHPGKRAKPSTVTITEPGELD